MTLGGRYLEGVFDNIIWYARDKERLKFRRLFLDTSAEGDSHWNYALTPAGETEKLTAEQIRNHRLLPEGLRLYQLSALYPAGSFATGIFNFPFRDKTYAPPTGRSWKSPIDGMMRLAKADRIEPYKDGETLRYRLFLDDYPVSPIHNIWADTAPASDKVYVVQTSDRVIERCLLMTTDPGDLVLDPTCGSGTTAYVAEHWGRRWITTDTSRVALTLARARLMGAKFDYYLLKDSEAGAAKETEIVPNLSAKGSFTNNIRQGFIYKRARHITLKSITNNPEIDLIWERWEKILDPLRESLNKSVKQTWKEWQVPHPSNENLPEKARQICAEWWDARHARQKEIDESIRLNAVEDAEILYDSPRKSAGYRACDRAVYG